MEFIVENETAQTFLKVNGKFTPGIAFLKIFDSEHDAQEFVEDQLAGDHEVVVKPYSGFTS